MHQAGPEANQVPLFNSGMIHKDQRQPQWRNMLAALTAGSESHTLIHSPIMSLLVAAGSFHSCPFVQPNASSIGEYSCGGMGQRHVTRYTIPPMDGTGEYGGRHSK